MRNINSFYKTIEMAIFQLGINPDQTRTEEKGKWSFSFGSAFITAGILNSDRFPNGYFYVNSNLMSLSDLPESSKLLFFKTLVEMNASLVNMKLCITGNQIILLSNRDATGLDVEEVAHTIDELSHYADLLDDKLKNMFSS